MQIAEASKPDVCTKIQTDSEAHTLIQSRLFCFIDTIQQWLGLMHLRPSLTCLPRSDERMNKSVGAICSRPNMHSIYGTPSSLMHSGAPAEDEHIQCRGGRHRRSGGSRGDPGVRCRGRVRAAGARPPAADCSRPLTAPPAHPSALPRWSMQASLLVPPAAEQLLIFHADCRPSLSKLSCLFGLQRGMMCFPTKTLNMAKCNSSTFQQGFKQGVKQASQGRC